MMDISEIVIKVVKEIPTGRNVAKIADIVLMYSVKLLSACRK